MMAEERLPVQVASRALGVSESGYYAWRSRSPSARSVRHALVSDAISAIHTASHSVYGFRCIDAELTLGRGITVSHGTVELLMQRAGIRGLPGNRRRRPRHDTPTAADLVDRQFTRSDRDQLWVTDITEHPTREGKVYCAVVLDTYSRRVVGWSIGSSQTAALVTNALSMAIGNRRPQGGTIIHSDHGTQFTSWAFTQPRPRIRPGPLDGNDRRLLRQRRDRILLGTHADRAAEPKEVAHPSRTRQRDLRVPGDLPQPPAPPLLTWNAHPDNCPASSLEPRKPTPGNPGHIT